MEWYGPSYFAETLMMASDDRHDLKACENARWMIEVAVRENRLSLSLALHIGEVR